MQFRVNGIEIPDISQKLDTAELTQVKDGNYHLIIDSKSYKVSDVTVDINNKCILCHINSKSYRIELKDEFDNMIEEMGFDKADTSVENDVRAPMPGLVLDIVVKEDSEVAPGDTLLILEAMKMENVIKATRPGVVKSIEVSTGDSVEKNALLINYQE